MLDHFVTLRLHRIVGGFLVGVALALATLAHATRPSAVGGASHSYVLGQDGLVRASGANAFGQLGNGNYVASSSFVNVIATQVHDIVQIAAGVHHGLALRGDGTVWAWGHNGWGQLGNNAIASSNVPVQATATGFADIVFIAASGYSSYAIDRTGKVWAWGLNNQGQLGDGTTTDRHSPIKLVSLAGVVSVVTASASVHALLSDGTMRAWGYNVHGQLGTGDKVNRTSPAVSQPTLNNVVRIAVTQGVGYAVLEDGKVRAWGTNSALGGGQLGNGTTADSLMPVVVQTSAGTPLDCVAEIAGSANSALAIDCEGIAYVWGSPGSASCLGPSSTPYTYATPIVGIVGAAGVFGQTGNPSANPRSYIYQQGNSLNGALSVCGFNTSGELGTGDLITRSMPALLAFPPGSKVGKRTNFTNAISNADVFWRKSDGTNVIWDYQTSGAAGYESFVMPGVDTSWIAKGTGDITGDSISDVVWFQPSSGQVAIWKMVGFSTIGGVSFPGSVGAGSSWQLQAIGDMDGDSRADLLWRNATSGEVLVWFMRSDGSIDQSLSYGIVPSSYQIRALADVNGDWLKDIVWFQPSTGQVVVWKMEPGGGYDAWFPASVGGGSGWDIYKVGDFDGDGREDLFWRRSDGTTAVSYLNGPAIVATQFLGGVLLSDWSMHAVGDYDGDGREDVLWLSSASGQVVRWLMKGRAISAIVQSVVGIGPGWQSVQ